MELPTGKRWTVRLELDARQSDDEKIVDALADYHPALGRTPQGRPEVVVTIVAEGLRQAVTTAMSVTKSLTGLDVYAVEAVPAEEFDSRRAAEPVPQLLSVSETA